MIVAGVRSPNRSVVSPPWVTENDTGVTSSIPASSNGCENDSSRLIDRPSSWLSIGSDGMIMP